MQRTVAAKAAKAKAAPAVKPQVKGRKPSAAAAVMNGDDSTAEAPAEATAPKPRAAKVRRAAAPKVDTIGHDAEAAQAAAENADQPDQAQPKPAPPKGAVARKAALKARLENEQQAVMGLLIR